MGFSVAGGDRSSESARSVVLSSARVAALAIACCASFVSSLARADVFASRDVAALRGAQRTRSHRRPPPVTRPAGPNADQVREVVERVHRSGAAPRCWNAFIAQNAESPSVQFRLRIETDGAGGVRSVLVLDPTPVAFAECVQTQVRGLTNVPGPSLTATTTYAFRAGLAAPVPVFVAPSAAASPTPSTAPAAAP